MVLTTAHPDARDMIIILILTRRATELKACPKKYASLFRLRTPVFFVFARTKKAAIRGKIILEIHAKRNGGPIRTGRRLNVSQALAIRTA